MKKNFIIIFSIFIVIIASIIAWYTNTLGEQKKIAEYNLGFTQYTEKDITGVDVTTVINKAIDNNEQYSIEKNEKSVYKDDKKYSVQVFIKVVKDGEYYPMEAFYLAGITDFTKAYAGAIFKTKNIEYHENGRISKIFFEIT